MKKIYQYMAFYITETDEFKTKQKFSKEPQSFEQICALMEKDGAFDVK
jgi:hypothetical protein